MNYRLHRGWGEIVIADIMEHIEQAGIHSVLHHLGVLISKRNSSRKRQATKPVVCAQNSGKRLMEHSVCRQGRDSSPQEANPRLALPDPTNEQRQSVSLGPNSPLRVAGRANLRFIYEGKILQKHYSSQAVFHFIRIPGCRRHPGAEMRSTGRG